MQADATADMDAADRLIHDVLCSVTPADRVVALACAILDSDASTADAVVSLVAITRVMSRRLPDAQRLAIAWALLESAEDLNARWN